MIGQILFLHRLEEVTPSHVMHILMTSKKKFSPAGVSRGIRLMSKLGARVAKAKGVKAAVTDNVDAIHHATRHPAITKAIKAGSYGGAEASSWPWPWHPWAGL